MTSSFELAKSFLSKRVTVTIDRPLGSKHPEYGFEYKVNYGFIKGIKAPDGEDLDAYYLGVKEPIEEKEGICIALIHRKDNDDDKLVVAPEGKDFSDEEIMEMVHFQEQWFDSEVIR